MQNISISSRKTSYFDTGTQPCNFNPVGGACGLENLFEKDIRGLVLPVRELVKNVTISWVDGALLRKDYATGLHHYQSQEEWSCALADFQFESHEDLDYLFLPRSGSRITFELFFRVCNYATERNAKIAEYPLEIWIKISDTMGKLLDAGYTLFAKLDTGLTFEVFKSELNKHS